ncbi:MAG: ATP-binding protein [Candidatus Heimdallarchaeaceae archaeon]
MINKQTSNSVEIDEAKRLVDSYIIKDIEEILSSNENSSYDYSLSERVETYHFLFNRLNDAVFFFQIKENYQPSKLLVVNESASFLLGYSKEEFLEMSIRDLYDEENLIKAKKEMTRVFKEGQYVFEIEQINKFGSSIPVEINSHRFDLGRNKYILSIVRDIRDRVKSKAELEELLEEKTLLLDIIAHDLRNHNLVALGYLYSYFTFEESSDEEKIDFLQNTKSAIRRVGFLLDNLTTKIRSDLNTQSQLIPINILESIHNTEIILKELYPRKKIIIDTNNLGSEKHVLADKMFEHLILNLFTNAVKNTPGESVTIKIDHQLLHGKRCYLSIIDFGTGIPTEERYSILLKLENKQFAESTSGLGLQIIQTLVERYKGRVFIENYDDDDYSKGTIFKLGLLTA